MAASLPPYFEGFAEYLRTGDERCLHDCFDPSANTDLARIYRNGFRKTCINALAANYPCIAALVGEDYFRTLALHYIDHYPPSQPSLVGYGNRFPELLAETLVRHRLPYLVDVARLDQAWLDSYFASDQQAVSAEDIAEWADAGRDVSGLVLTRCTHARLVENQHAVGHIWTEIRGSSTLANQVHVVAVPESMLLWRAERTIHARVLAAAERAFLQALPEVPTVGEAASMALAVDAEFDLPGFFAALLAHGLLCHPGVSS
jgi:hypothetical protein